MSHVSTAIDDSATRRRRRPVTPEGVGVVLMTLIVVTALAGVWGNGTLSHRQAGAGALSVEYQRFVREYGQTSLTVHVRPDGIRAGTVTLMVSQRLLDRFEVTAVTPDPSTARLANSSYEYAFNAGGSAPMTIDFRLIPRAAGSASGTVHIGHDTANPVQVRQFVYP